MNHLLLDAGNLRSKIASDSPVVGSWISIPHAAVAETISSAGFDFVIADGEHSTTTAIELPSILPAFEKNRVPLIYRVPDHSPNHIRAALDAGASGIMAPMIETAADAAALIASAKYPPIGRRGIGPWRASHYYEYLSEYLSAANDKLLIFAQIESLEGMRNAEEIAETIGIDVIFVGPADLAASMGLELGPLHDELRACYAKLAALSQKFSVRLGIDVGDLALIEEYRKIGFSVFTHGQDISYLQQGSRKTLDDIRAICS